MHSLHTEDWKAQDGEQNSGKGEGQPETEIMAAPKTLEAVFQQWGSTLFHIHLYVFVSQW